MINRNASAICIFGLLMCTSCSHNLTPFTKQLYDQQRWEEPDLKKIQFYISHDIIMQRNASQGITRIERGKIKLLKGEKLDKVVIRRGTPGVFLFSPKEDRFAICFEEAEPPRFLMFGPNPNYGNRFTLLGKEWDRHSGVITYDQKEYLAPSESAMAYLLVDLRKTRKVQVQEREVRGRKID